MVKHYFPDGPDDVSVSLVPESEQGQLYYYNKCPGLYLQMTCTAFNFYKDVDFVATEKIEYLNMGEFQCGTGYCKFRGTPTINGDHTFHCAANNRLNTSFSVSKNITTTLVVQGNLLLHCYFCGNGGGAYWEGSKRVSICLHD